MKVSIMEFFISMVPVVELRGAIPLAIAQGMLPLRAFFIAVVGNMVPVPFIILFLRRVLQWLRVRSVKFDALAVKLEDIAEKKAGRVKKYEKAGLCILVAIPLPGTGAWTGALVAAMAGMRLKDALPSIALGVVIAGVIVLLMCLGVLSLG